MAILSFQIKYCHWNKTGVSSTEWEQGYKLNKQCNGAMCVFCLRTFCQQTTRCAKIGPKLKNVVEPFFPHRFFPKSFEQQIPNVEDDQIKKLIYLEPRVFLLLKCLQLFQILYRWIHFFENVYFLNSMEYQDGI